MNDDNVITISFKNNYLITDRLLKLALENLYERPEYENIITYNSVHDDSFVYQISCDKTGEHVITITRYGENEIETKIQGQQRYIMKFMNDLLAEITVIILSSGLETLYKHEISPENQAFLKKQIKELIQTLSESESENENENER